MPGTVGTAPFGSNVRSIVINVDPDRLRSYNLTPDDVVKALTTGNVIVPAGNLYIKDQMPLVPTNAMVVDIQEIGKIPVQAGPQRLHRRRGQGRRQHRRQLRLCHGGRPTLGLHPRRQEEHRFDADRWWPTSTAPCRRFKSVLPEGVDIRYEFDESPTVVEAIRSVGTEGAIGAALTGLMILLFLRDWRSVIVVVFNIPDGPARLRCWGCG